MKINECTKVQNPRRHDHELDPSVYNTSCANSQTRRRYRNLRVTGSTRKTFSQRRRLKRKKLTALLSSRIPGSVSLLLAFLGPLEGSAVEKVRRMSLQYFVGCHG